MNRNEREKIKICVQRQCAQTHAQAYVHTHKRSHTIKTQALIDRDWVKICLFEIGLFTFIFQPMLTKKKKMKTARKHTKKKKKKKKVKRTKCVRGAIMTVIIFAFFFFWKSFWMLFTCAMLPVFSRCELWAHHPNTSYPKHRTNVSLSTQSMALAIRHLFHFSLFTNLSKRARALFRKWIFSLIIYTFYLKI